jgi:dienelactone hydrolase
MLAAVRAHARAIGFVIRLLPLFPARPIDWVTRAPVIERVSYPMRGGTVEGDLYRPPGRGPHPAIVLCLGVVPFGVDHPQIPRLEAALARFGFVALIHWSTAMRDRRLVPEDSENIALAYDWLVRRPDVDPARSGLFGTCVGGSFALLAAAHPLICDRVAFVGAFAPFSRPVPQAAPRCRACAARRSSELHLRVYRFFAGGPFWATAAFTSALNARASTFSPSWMSIALRVLPSKLELKRRDGSGVLAPLANVSFTTFVYASPVQTIPWCDQTGVPGLDALIHFNSSVISGSASRISARMRARVSPRHPPTSRIRWSMSPEAGFPVARSLIIAT